MIQTIESMLSHLSDFHPAWQFLLIALSVGFVEEFAVFAVFALARHGDIPWWLAISGIFTGAWSAQSLTWLVGRIAGHKALSWKIFRKLQESGKLESIHHHVVREGWIAVAIMRFVPGTRIAVCLGAGILGMGALEFLGVLTVATIAWILTCLGLVQTIIDAVRGKPGALLLGIAVATPLLLLARAWIRRRRARNQAPPRREAVCDSDFRP